MTGEGGPGRVRFLELLSGMGREPGTKAQLQDDCAWALTPPTRNRRSGLTRGETIVDSGGGIGMGARLRGMVSPIACGSAPAQSWKALGGRSRAECSLGCGLCLVEFFLISLRYLMPIPYQQRGMREDAAHSSLSLFWINV